MELTREQKLEAQREFVRTHSCIHIIQCAQTDEDRARATELIRSGNAYEAAIGMMMLTGPCTKKETA